MSNRFDEVLDYEVWLEEGCDGTVNGLYYKHSICTGTALDFAFFGAHYARSNYRFNCRNNQGGDRERNSKGYFGNSVSRMLHTEAERNASTAYWEYPGIMRMLLDHGFKRTKPKEMDFEPSYNDAVSLWSFDPIPDEEHWGILYDLRILDDDWEQQAFEKVLDKHLLYGKFGDWPALAKRWPELQNVLNDKASHQKLLLRAENRRETVGHPRSMALRNSSLIRNNRKTNNGENCVGKERYGQRKKETRGVKN
ncbi:ankyrin [Penicillium cosmopolitanum]|uniref:Ankyrin n=1 Tax=Penicillium cosmopolitanum TaxID=1131564 RepID=A0A9W9W726_9EURO|nr:ankyrin [Penicillium cosmopolitanum]KAJ5404511.1 ankyrin [Penicillium cosmopolitanum]